MLEAAIHLLKDLGIWQGIQMVLGIVFTWAAYVGFVERR